jgi:predicted transcriptional regulator
VLVTSEVRDQFSGDPGRVGLFSEAQVRVVPSEFAFSCTDDALCLVFPNRADGEWQATLVAETDAALQWGTDLFESLWQDAEPIDDDADDQFAMTGRRGWVGVSRSHNSGHY